MNIDAKEVEKIVRKAGNYLLTNFGEEIAQKHKSDTHFDTIYDKKVSDIYKSELSKLYPDIQFYSEEDQVMLDPNMPYWMIDPIEGTTNFARSIAFFATQLAYIQDGLVKYGAVYLPTNNEMYTASDNQGSFCNGKRINVGDIAKLNEAVVNIGKGTGIDNLTWWGNTAAKLVSKSRTIRLIGATGAEICLVASGKLDLHINHGSHNYDYAAGSIIAKEAGATILNFEGKPWTINDQNIIIGNQKLVNQIIKEGHLQ